MTQTVTFAAVPPGKYPVTFEEYGLPSGQLWSVSLNGTTENSTNSYIIFTVSNGTYPFSLGSVTSCTSTVMGGIANVTGSSVAFSVPFACPSPPPGGGMNSVLGPFGLPGIEGYALAGALGGAGAAIVTLVGIALTRRGGKPPPGGSLRPTSRGLGAPPPLP
jgi:hypothetical protein